MIVFVAAGFSLRCTGETPVPPKGLGEKYSIGRNSVLVAKISVINCGPSQRSGLPKVPL
jgi:hypothetical protein